LVGQRHGSQTATSPFRLLIIAHEAAETFNVGTENGSEFAFQAFLNHGIFSHLEVLNESGKNDLYD